MRTVLTVLLLAIGTTVLTSAADAQVRSQRWLLETRTSPLLLDHEAAAAQIRVDGTAARLGVGIHPLLRTILVVAASTGGYYLADENLDGDLIDSDSDVQYEPIAIGSGAGAVAGIAFSTANPIRVILGSALAALPAAALSTFIDGNLKEGDPTYLPAVSFGAIHGLLTSAFSQNR